MNNIINIPQREQPDRPDIEEEARAWIVQLDSARPTDEELREFRDWLNRSPLHKQVFKQVAAVWNDMDILSGLLDVEIEKESKVTSGKATDFRSTFGLSGLNPVKLSAVFILGLTVTIACYIFVPGFLKADTFAAEYQTAVGELKAVSLPDGSNVRLNTASKMDVSFNRESRVVRLAEGEAYFDVSHNPDKPFVVYAGKFAIKAIGTAFSVQVIDDGVDVTVTEGRVEVVSMKDTVHQSSVPNLKQIDDASTRVPMVKGQHVIFNEEKQEIELAQQVKPEDIEKKLSWRDGMLIFDNDSLEDVVSEINRYTSTKIVISDSDLRDLRFGGYFRIDDMSSILDTFEEAFGIKVDRINENLIYLSRRENTQ